MKKLIFALAFMVFQYSTAKTDEVSAIGVVVNSCTVVGKKTSITYKELNSCLKNKIIRSFLNPNDKAMIYLSTQARNNQEVRVEINWQPFPEGRLSSLSEIFIWSAEYPRELWSDLLNQKNDNKLHELKFKKSLLGNAVATIEQGFSFGDIFYNESIGEAFYDLQKIEISIMVLGALNRQIQYKGDLLMKSRLKNEIKFEILTDINPLRTERSFYLNIIGSEAKKEIYEALP